jgi:hypothetical protein
MLYVFIEGRWIMVTFLSGKRAGRPPKKPQKTSVSFSVADLEDLGQLLAVGQAILQKPAPVVARLKAAMTRIGVSTPKSL